jgi:alpha-1,2-rhamnosyltransferase
MQKVKAAYSTITGPRINYRPGDVLVLLDATWGIPIWPAVERARQSGAVVAAVVYDLIPVSHPHFFRSELADTFRLWLHAAAQRVDYFVTISEAVATQLRDFLETNQSEAGKPLCVRSFPLGANLDKVKQQTKVRAELHQIFDQATSTYLSVGTIEPRKNHLFLIDAFEQVWRQLPASKLCVVGRLGWLCDDIVNRFREHPRYGKNLFLLHGVTDAELSYCYQQAKALVYPSIIEGYGLPLIEAMQYDLPVLASDTPIHHEVCGEFAEYFSLNSPASLAALVQKCELDFVRREGQEQTSFTPMSWDESCSEFLKANLACLAELEAAKSRAEGIHRQLEPETRAA